MPIVKSSKNGELITTMIYTEEEVQALIHLLQVADYPDDDETAASMITLHELQYALDFSFGYV